MARYGRIKHIECGNTNYIKFENVAARREFAKAFEAYHASHDHDGAVPVFEEINTADVKSFHTNGAPTWGDKYLTIDGYQANEILSYHRWDGVKRSYNEPRYRPPTSCISPLVVLEEENLRGDGPFVDSGTFERHALSAIFMDMPDADFENLLRSIETDGFIDNHIRIHEGKVLDGWHRYRAALELNIVRKLRFTVWDAEDEGSPEAFVMARNIERRHLTPGQRAQIIVSFNERFGHGGDRTESKSPNGDLKTRQELAKEAGVGERTIDRAVKVEKSGQAEQVISGEKSASAIIDEITVKELFKQIAEEMKGWKQRHTGVGYASKSTLIQVYRERTESDQEGAATADELKGILGLMREDSHSYVLGVRYSDSDERKSFEVDKAQQRYKDAEKQVWQTLWERKKQVHAQNFITAACDAHPAWGVDNFPKDMESTDMPSVWIARFDLVVTEINIGSGWVTTFLESEYSELGSEKMEPKSVAEVAEPTDVQRLSEGQEKASSDQADAEAEKALDKAIDSLSKTVEEFDKCFMEDLGFSHKDYGRLCDLAAVEIDCDRDMLYMIIFDEDCPEDFGASDLNQWETIVCRILEDFQSGAEWTKGLRSGNATELDEDETEPTETESPTPDEQVEVDSPSLGEKTKTLKLQILEHLPTWKQHNPDTMYATLFHLCDARFRIEHGIPRGRSPFFFEELEDLFPLMKDNDPELADKVREILATDSSGVKSSDQKGVSVPETPEGDDQADTESEACAQGSEMLSDFNYRLDNFHISINHKDGSSAGVIAVHTFPSNQLGDIPMSEVPDTLEIELLKFIESIKGK